MTDRCVCSQCGVHVGSGNPYPIVSGKQIDYTIEMFERECELFARSHVCVCGGKPDFLVFRRMGDESLDSGQQALVRWDTLKDLIVGTIVDEIADTVWGVEIGNTLGDGKRIITAGQYHWSLPATCYNSDPDISKLTRYDYIIEGVLAYTIRWDDVHEGDE